MPWPRGPSGPGSCGEGVLLFPGRGSVPGPVGVAVRWTWSGALAPTLGAAAPGKRRLLPSVPVCPPPLSHSMLLASSACALSLAALWDVRLEQGTVWLPVHPLLSRAAACIPAGMWRGLRVPEERLQLWEQVGAVAADPSLCWAGRSPVDSTQLSVDPWVAESTEVLSSADCLNPSFLAPALSSCLTLGPVA